MATFRLWPVEKIQHSMSCRHPVAIRQLDQLQVRCLSQPKVGLSELARAMDIRLKDDGLAIQAGQMADISDPDHPKILSMPAHLRLTLGLKLDINRCSANELSQLPGIGPVKAKQITADRQLNGPFSNVEDIVRVKGIGPGIYKRIRSYIVP